MLTERSERIRSARALTRRSARVRRGLFLAEGRQAVAEALAEAEGPRPGLTREVFVEAGNSAHSDLVERARALDVPVREVEPTVMAALSETVTPQGLVAVCDQQSVPLRAALAPPPRLAAVLVAISDPGNAGTVLRTADAAGAQAVIFTGDAVDPYNGKCVRGSAGSLFHVRLVRCPDPGEAVAGLRAAGLQVLAATGAGETDLERLADRGGLATPTGWLFGSEAHGLPERVAAAADARVRVPIHGRAESLNLGAAAAVCLYASARSLRQATSPGWARSPHQEEPGA